MASGAWFWNTAVAFQFPPTYCISVLEVWLQLSPTWIAIHHPCSICAGSQFNDHQRVARTCLWIGPSESHYSCGPGVLPAAPLRSASVLCDTQLCLSLHAALRRGHPRGVWMKTGEVPPSPRWVLVLCVVPCKPFMSASCCRWSELPEACFPTRCLKFFVFTSLCPGETSCLFNIWLIGRRVTSQCGGRCLEPQSVPSAGGLFISAVVMCSSQRLPPLLTLHSPEVWQLSLITGLRSKLERLIDWFVAWHLSHSVSWSAQLLSGVTSRRCSRVFRSR